MFRAHGQVVHGDEDPEEDQHAHSGEGAITRVPLAEVGDDLAPLSERVEHHERQTRPCCVYRVLIPLWFQKPDGQCSEDQEHADIAEHSEKSLDHGVTRATFPCPPTAWSGTTRS